MAESEDSGVGGLVGTLFIVLTMLVVTCIVVTGLVATFSAAALYGGALGGKNYFAALRETLGPEPIDT